MSLLIICDGCGKQLDQFDLELCGTRATGSGGGGLPEGAFHLCQVCAVVAFHAMVTRTGPVDEHKLAKAICDAKRAKAGAR